MQKENEFTGLFEKLSETALRLRNTNANERIAKLRKLKKAVEENETQICEAVYKDFGKAPAETKLTEIYPLLSELKLAVRKLRKWMKPRKVTAPASFFGSRNFVRYESKGVVLIISPWNYPFQLAVAPLVSAIAAGNAVVIKPSEISSHTAEFIKKFVAEIFSDDEITVINGGAKTAQKLLELPFNHVYFTGSPAIGKIVMKSAAENLTSVTLELGGKSPAIIDKNYDHAKAAEKIMWGKLINAGQTCIAPDYVLTHESKTDEFVSAAIKSIGKFYGDAEKFETNPDYCGIINDAHYNRLKFLFDDALEKGARAVYGGKFGANRRISPAVLVNVNFRMRIMQEEIFGPLLPVLTYKTEEDILQTTAKNPHPLAMYVFSDDNSFRQKMLDGIQSGGAAINDTVVHFANYNLPFGGTGTSGTGNAHGFYGFKTFSHERAVMIQSKFSPLKFMYPPYSERTKKFIDFVAKYF